MSFNVGVFVVFKFVILFVLLLLVFGQAEGTINKIRPTKTEESSQRSQYSVIGGSLEGRLVAYPYLPPGWEFPTKEQGGGENVVSLRRYLWFPNPLSSPEVFVVVREPSSFQLVLLDEAGRLMEELEFRGIDTGVYVFTLKEPKLPVSPCSIRLMLDGVPAGEVDSRTHRSSYRW